MKTILPLLLLLNFSLLCAQKSDMKAESKKFQDNLNKEYSNREESPLTDEDFKSFKGLDFYPINEKFIVEAKFKRTPDEKIFKMKTTGPRLPDYVKYGELTFKIEGKNYKLNLYQSVDLVTTKGYEDYLFLPFSDLSCGKESYIGGRYIDMRIPKGNSVTIDFNKAYNPYCAYSPLYSCPVVPLENDLNIEILAGVKKFHD